MRTKSVLISIKPEWIREIENGHKTIEVRKTRVRMEPPFRVYVYCTMTGEELYRIGREGSILMNGSVCMEFTCEDIDIIDQDSNGYMFRKHWLEGDPNVRYFRDFPGLLKDTGLTEKQLDQYLGIKTGYAWHVKDVRLYDEPINLGEFRSYESGRRMKHPPQSIVYVSMPDGGEI